jgi:hypothetical protein
MEETTISYYLVKFDDGNLTGDFARILELLGGYPQLHIEPTGATSVRITHEKSNQPVELTITPFRMVPALGEKMGMLLTLGRTDSAALHLLRGIARSVGYRVFHTAYQALMVQDPDLVDAGQLDPSEKIAAIFREIHLKPVYLHSETSVQYGISDTDRSVHIINPGMFQYFYDNGVDANSTAEFSYPVASSIVQFAAYYDAGLIPTNFYRYFRRDQKIINYSFIDVRSPERPLRIRPSIHIYNALFGTYEPLAPDPSGTPAVVTLGPNESIDATLLGVVRDQMNVARGYQRAKVGEYVSFEGDAANILTPLLHVDIYLTQAEPQPKANEQPQRGWDRMAAG